jgi:thiamine-phosphate pyrophosphorylase
VLRYHITDRKQAGGLGPLLEMIRRNLLDGVEMIQLREKDLPARELVEFLRRVLVLPNPHGSKILVNERLDVAMAAGAQGVHLPSNAIPPATVRSFVPREFLVGVSCHETAEIEAAAAADASFVVYGPVFAPLSKAPYLPPVGLVGLRAAVRAVRIPVLALGGITAENAASCIAVGAAGVAGITLFQQT